MQRVRSIVAECGDWETAFVVVFERRKRAATNFIVATTFLER
jgi:hypothetical protein